MTSVSTELINYSGMATINVQTFMDLCSKQGFTELTLRLNAMTEWPNGKPSATYVAKAKEIMIAAEAKGIAASIDMHTWYTTWDSKFRDGATNVAANRAKYLTYVKAAIDAFAGYDIKAWMLLNEPQARKATIGENGFILSIIGAAQSKTSKPVSIRFMGGYSPTTGHYAAAIDEACDFICRNTYWDPRNPGTSVYGTTEAKMNAVIAYAKSQGKELWITEFGKSKSNKETQRAYVSAWVDYAMVKGIDRIFCWVSQPIGGSTENYNIWTGMTPNPAFYELVSSEIIPPPVVPTYSVTISSIPSGIVLIQPAGTTPFVAKLGPGQTLVVNTPT